MGNYVVVVGVVSPSAAGPPRGSVEKNGNFQVAKLCARGLNNVVDLWSWL